MIRVGVVGYGYWGPNLVRNFAEAAGAEVAAICDLRPARLDLARQRCPAARLVTDATALIDAPDIDAVVVATPVGTHFALAQRALLAGKHVLVEKPLTSSSADAATLIDEAARASRILMVDHTFAYTPAVQRIRDLVRDGDLGDIYYYDSVRVNLGLFQHDVNVLWDLAVHDLAILDLVLPCRPTAVSAIGLSHFEGEPENIAYLTLLFEGRLIAHVHANWLAPVKVRRTLIGGSRRMIVYDDLEASEKVKVFDRGAAVEPGVDGVYQMRVGYRTGDMWSPHLNVDEALAIEVRHFLTCIERGTPPLTDGEAGRRVVRLLEAADCSMAQGGRLVPLDSR